MDEETLREPSKLPSKTNYERVNNSLGRLTSWTSPKNISEDSRNRAIREAQHYYVKSRLEAKREVIEGIPEMLKEYQNELLDESDIRKLILPGLLIVSAGWLVGTLIFMSLTGTEAIKFSLDSRVLVAFIAGAGVSLLSLLGTAISYYYNKSKEQIAMYEGLFKTMLEDEDESSSSK